LADQPNEFPKIEISWFGLDGIYRSVPIRPCHYNPFGFNSISAPEIVVANLEIELL